MKANSKKNTAAAIKIAFIGSANLGFKSKDDLRAKVDPTCSH